MKRLFLAALLMLLLAAGLAAAIAYDPGYVLIAFGPYTLETSVWIGLALLLVILALMYLLMALGQRVRRQGSLFSRWQSDHRQRRGRQLTERGILALIEGNFDRARHILDRAAARSDMPVVNYLMAARASAALGDAKQTQLYLMRAERAGARHGVAVELTQAELQLRSGQLEESLASLSRARRSAGKNPYVLRLLRDVYTGLHDWRNLLLLLPDLRRQQVLSDTELAELELSATLHLLEDAGTKGQREALQALWQKLSKALSREPHVVATYARALAAAGDEAEAERVLRTQLKRSWSRELMAVYGRVAGADAAQQLAFAERQLEDHGNDAALLLCLGRLSLRGQLWGKARDYFERSLRQEEQPETCAELGRLLARLGKYESASACYERGLRLSTRNLPQLPLPGQFSER